MSNMKCPICNTNLEVLVGGANAVLGCPRCRYKASDGVWQELTRTHKALDVAVDVIKELRPAEKKSCYLVPTVSTTQRIIDEALEQITALTNGGNNE